MRRLPGYLHWSVKPAETLARNWLNTQRATRNGDTKNHIAEHHLQTKHQIDWESATCLRNIQTTINGSLESWVTNLERTPMNRSQQLPAPYKGLTDEIKQN